VANQNWLSAVNMSKSKARAKWSANSGDGKSNQGQCPCAMSPCWAEPIVSKYEAFSWLLCDAVSI
jgi:hypothetical protein